MAITYKKLVITKLCNKHPASSRRGLNFTHTFTIGEFPIRFLHGITLTFPFWLPFLRVFKFSVDHKHTYKKKTCMKNHNHTVRKVMISIRNNIILRISQFQLMFPPRIIHIDNFPQIFNVSPGEVHSNFSAPKCF